MYILVKHDLQDPKAFFEKGKEILPSFPKDLVLHNSFALKGGSEVVCVWEASSIDKLRDVMDPPTQGISKNEYREVDAEKSINLPQLRRAA